MGRTNQPTPQGVLAKETTIEKTGTPDRVTYSYGMTLSLERYESVRFDYGMSSDVRPGEKPEQAMQRCGAVVDPLVEAEAERIIKARGGK